MRKIPVKHPTVIKFNSSSHTTFFNSRNNITLTISNKVSLLPEKMLAEICAKRAMSTWEDSPYQFLVEGRLPKPPIEVFKDILRGKLLQNSLEDVNFEFCVNGLTLIEVTHILRHRMIKGVHAQCTADRFMNDDSAFIPASIEDSGFVERYKSYIAAGKALYCDMVDGGISLMDARYILPRSLRSFYHFSMDLKTAIAFIKQRRCTIIQPELDNIIAWKMYKEICNIYPSVSEVLKFECDSSCHALMDNDEYNTRLYAFDLHHINLYEKKFGRFYDYKNHNPIYGTTRENMGILSLEEIKRL